MPPRGEIRPRHQSRGGNNQSLTTTSSYCLVAGVTVIVAPPRGCLPCGGGHKPPHRRDLRGCDAIAGFLISEELRRQRGWPVPPMLRKHRTFHTDTRTVCKAAVPMRRHFRCAAAGIFILICRVSPPSFLSAEPGPKLRSRGLSRTQPIASDQGQEACCACDCTASRLDRSARE